MDNRFELNDKLNFDEIDLTAPDVVINDILSELPKATQNYIYGDITAYYGNIESYRISNRFKSVAELLDSDREKDIQEDLGGNSNENYKYECYLYTPEYDEYRYRLFFMEYGISNYPVKIVLEESIAKSAFIDNKGYIYNCNTREELETLFYSVLNSKRGIEIMQYLIRISQAKQLERSQAEEVIKEEEE